jgi:hypothetical protein
MVFSFPPKERVPFSLPRKDDGSLRQGRLLSASACARWDDTTIKKEQ